MLALPHETAHSPFRYCVGTLLPNPLSDATRGVPLFAWSQLICAQNLVNELHHRTQPGLVPHRQFALRRNRTRQRLSQHPPMHAQLLRDRANRISSVRMFPPDLIE